MKNRLLLSLLALLALSCAQNQAKTNNAICKTGNGDVNTYNPIGVWKRIPVTAEEKLNWVGSNFHLLYILDGGLTQGLSGGTVDGIKITYTSLVCERNVSGNHPADVARAGFYFLDDSRNRIRANFLDLQDPSAEREENWVEYKFTGNCLDTIMTLTYRPSGRKERYNYFSDKIPENSCPSE